MEPAAPPKDKTPDADPAYAPPKGSARAGSVTLRGGARMDYEALAEWLVLRKNDKPAAEVFHIYYRASDGSLCAGQGTWAERPLTFLFNGGPGAASAYLHLGCAGPRRVVFGPRSEILPPPVKLVDNEETWLAFSDIVCVDPVGTGFSRVIDRPAGAGKPAPPADGATSQDAARGKDADPKEYYGFKRDIEAMCEFIGRFLSKHGRWASPIFIAGESYGGFRVAKLVRELQERTGVGLNGAIIVSPALEMPDLQGSDYDAGHWLDLVPTQALAAWHHGRSRAFAPETLIAEARAAVEGFMGRELAPFYIAGEMGSDEERRRVLAQLSDFIGIDAEALQRRGGRLDHWDFARELLRDQRRVCGLYDASVSGIDPFPDRPAPAHPDPTLAGFERIFAAGINAHLRVGLGVDTDRLYALISDEVNEAWKIDFKRHALETQLGATDDLRYGMALNPFTKVSISHGYYDLVTPYFTSERIARHMKLDPQIRRNLTLKHFRGGHMFYTWEASRRELAEYLAGFYAGAQGA